jgi:hypothetical protein
MMCKITICLADNFILLLDILHKIEYRNHAPSKYPLGAFYVIMQK